MRAPYQSYFPRLQDRVRDILASMPQCHGWDHTVRVRCNARHIARAEGADTAVTEYAAMLHDIGRQAEFDAPGRYCHAELGSEQAPEILRELGIADPAFIEHVAACVATHRYRRRSRKPPQSLEAKIVFDADKLDSMGAVGIGRAFHFAGRVGARVHNTRDEALAGNSYGLQDTAYREFLVKLQYLADSLLTTEGRRMGEERHRFMADFFRRLDREAAGDDYVR